MAKQRTFDARGTTRRFRPETVPPKAPKRFTATLGELALAKQIARAEARRRGAEE